MNTLVGQIPRHLYIWVDTKFTHKATIGFIPAVWFGLVSYPGRIWGCTVMFESGAIYRNIPLHAISFTDNPKKIWTPQDAASWDCYGWNWTALEYDYLRGLECKAKVNKKELLGEYLFTVAPVGDGFSAYPEQAKEFTFIKLDNGRVTSQPTNHVIFKELSFTSSELDFPKGFIRQTEIHTVE